MSRKRRKKRHGKGAVELNLAAMLDMAFQLLTFFIMTFKPAPAEGQIELKLPPPEAVTKVAGKSAGSETESKDILKGLNTLTITVVGNPQGRIHQMALGDTPVATVEGLNTRLREAFGPNSAFEQVIIQVGSDLQYDELMRVIDVCTKQTLPDGNKLSKLSFVELKTGG